MCGAKTVRDELQANETDCLRRARRSLSRERDSRKTVGARVIVVHRVRFRIQNINVSFEKKKQKKSKQKIRNVFLKGLAQ